MSANFSAQFPPSANYAPPPTDQLYPGFPSAGFNNGPNIQTSNVASLNDGSHASTHGQRLASATSSAISTPESVTPHSDQNTSIQANPPEEDESADSEGDSDSEGDGAPPTRGPKMQDFREEIEQRTREGESCIRIANDLKARGVKTSSKSISRLRIQWGLRKRSGPKDNTNRPLHYTKKPGYVSKTRGGRDLERKQIQRATRDAIAEMTSEGLSAEEIYQGLEARGLHLGKGVGNGVSTVRRLQTMYGLVQSAERSLKSFRHNKHRKAAVKQRKAFEKYAEDVGVEDPAAWVAQKMEEPASQELRRKLAYEMMGDYAPANPPPLNYNPQKRQTKKVTAAPRRTQNNTMRQGPPPSGFGRPDQHETRVPPAEQSYNMTKRPGDSVDANNDEATDDSESDHDDTLTSATFQPIVHFNQSGASRIDPYTDPNLSTHHHGMPGTNGAANGGSATDARAAHLPSASDHPYPSQPLTESHVLSVEEVEANQAMITSMDNSFTAMQRLKELMDARMNGRPMNDSLTGLPPTAVEVETAREQMKAVATAMLENS